MRTSERTDAISISGIRRVFEAADDDAINLGLGQPDFDTPENVKKAAVEAIETGKASSYTSNRGIPELREAVADRFSFETSPDDVIVTSGASEALHIAVEAHVDTGDEVLIPDPGFVSYEALSKVGDARPKGVELADDLRLEPESVKEAITDETSAFVVNSPANPTGAVQTRDDMRAFAEIADDYGVTLISDEVYEPFVYEGEHHSPAEFGENVVTVNAASKAYSMTGWRLGYVTAPETENMLRVHQYIQACASAPSQYAALEALEGPQYAVSEMKEEFEARRDLILDGFKEMGLDCPTPKGAFYAFPEVPDGFIDACIEEGVVVVPGDAFGEGGEGHARVSYANSRENLREALDVMESVLEDL
ncbi:MAG: pyridoxal phosphate-dependent aminotransferase [Halobacteria archaeon]|nr:pyridoxal phosphate-dependent aminotransferase [Halobacteria archaeon]